MNSLLTDIKYVKGVGDVMRKRFEKLSIDTVCSLFYYFPRDYRDWSTPIPISQTKNNEKCVIKGTVIAKPMYKKTTNSFLYETLCTDGTDFVKLIFWANKYLPNQLFEGEEYIFVGKMTVDNYGKHILSSPTFEKSQAGEGIHAVYRQTEGLTSKKISQTVKNAFDSYGSEIVETLNDEIRRKYHLMGLFDSLVGIHFPKSFVELEESRRRLVFDELLEMQLGLSLIRNGKGEKCCVKLEKDYSREFEQKLPFSLTNAQKRVINECIDDLQGKTDSASRLIQGDVGSGKTAVASSLIYTMARNGYQSVLMAPTSVLSRQHEENLRKFFDGTDIRVELLTGATTKKQREKIFADLIDGSIDCLVGTHALIGENVKFKNLGLVITDEQHRFGVEQRGSLTKKGDNPYTLVMSATPIPRTLGLIIYGDLSISVIDELPKGRQKIKTFLVDTSYHERIYRYIKKFLDDGKQAYIVCPLVEESEKEDFEFDPSLFEDSTELINAKDYYKNLSATVFANYNVGLLYGSMKPKEKDSVLEKFSLGEIQLLISTVVIEVGIDVPNACVMVIENAERYGLSQLHQLRGRIGRGQSESSCILVTDNKKEETLERLKMLCNTTDGFEIAKKDLELRGPGDFLGKRQHGLPDLKLANLMTDTKQLYETKKLSEQILSDDPTLRKNENIPLRAKVEKMLDEMIHN